MASMQSTDFLDRLLELRGISSEARQAFLVPSYEEHLHDPFLMSDMDRAVDRILTAVAGNEKIVIYSDYDADGIPGGVILHDFFKKINYENFSNYIPHRHDEGYGLHMDAVEQFVAEGVKLIITVDLGITAVAEVAYAQAHGVDVIVTLRP
jgi:single-stranded-DNA-specific exonuclease